MQLGTVCIVTETSGGRNRSTVGLASLPEEDQKKHILGLLKLIL